MGVPVPKADGLTLRCAWRGDFGSGHSLAVVNDGLTGALEQQGAEVVRRGRAELALDQPLVGVAGQWPPRFDAPAGGPFVLYQPWEFGCVPAQWVEPIRRTVDEVWTPSSASRDAYVAAGIAPELVQVMPNGVDLDRFCPEGAARSLPEADVTFLFVGGALYRKGIDRLIEAWVQAFGPDDGARLVLKTFGGDSFYRGATAEGLVAAAGSSVTLLDGQLGFDELPALYRAADVLVQPYRGEGFCLPALEALACGVPVIVTAGGSTDDFVSDACAWRIPAERVALARGWLPPELEPEGEAWLLEPDAAALARALREAADEHRRAEKAAQARAHAQRLGWTEVARIAAGRIAALSGGEPVRELRPPAVPNRRGFLFVADADGWADAVCAYASAFPPGADTTLLLPVSEPADVVAALTARGHDPDELADVALADTTEHGPAAIELAADAVIRVGGPGRARRTVPPDPVALRALVP
jgi:glycosyltransferase involved in cell wall biosynthesis